MSKDKGLVAVEVVDYIFILGRKKVGESFNAVVPVSTVQNLYIGSDGSDSVYTCRSNSVPCVTV